MPHRSDNRVRAVLGTCAIRYFSKERFMYKIIGSDTSKPAWADKRARWPSSLGAVYAHKDEEQINKNV